MEQLNALREQNKDLLKQLKQEKEAFEGLSGRCGAGVKRAEVQVLTGEDRSSARAALAKPSVRFAGNYACLIYLKGFKPVFEAR